MLVLKGPIEAESLAELVRACEEKMVRAVLKSYLGSVRDAALELGLARVSLYATMKRLGIPVGHGRRKGVVYMGVKADV